MCFSPEASFVSATVLTGIGMWMLSEERGWRWLMIAVTPWLFAAQQAAEGVLWLQGGQGEFAKWLYLLIAYCVWPWWLGVAVLQVEENVSRRRILAYLIGTGVVVALANFLYMALQGIGVRLYDNHIQYTNTVVWQGVLYLPLVSLPFFLSTRPFFWTLGVLGLVSFGVTLWAYWNNFTSVWCFFAAALSLWLAAVFALSHDTECDRGKSRAPAQNPVSKE